MCKSESSQSYENRACQEDFLKAHSKTRAFICSQVKAWFFWGEAKFVQIPCNSQRGICWCSVFQGTVSKAGRTSLNYVIPSWWFLLPQQGGFMRSSADDRTYFMSSSNWWQNMTHSTLVISDTSIRTEATIENNKKTSYRFAKRLKLQVWLLSQRNQPATQR